MDLFLQAGHGMQAHCDSLIKKWSGGTAILSPKNMSRDQMQGLSDKINKNHGEVLIDPQFYLPRTAISNLTEHSFWPVRYDTSSFYSGSGFSILLNNLRENYIEPMGVSKLIVPSLYIKEISEDWERITTLILNEVERCSFTIPKYLTLCVGVEIFKSEEKTHQLLELIEQYPVDGYYIIPVHPNSKYLVEDVSWMLNFLDFCAGLKLLSKTIIVGYCSHQFLVCALAKVDAICSGTWIKTRMFPIDDFERTVDEDTTRRKSTWYYCPQSLTEYQIPFLDIAHRVGVLNDLKTPTIYSSSESDVLFTGAQPSTVAYSERIAFRHYLTCLKTQCNTVEKESFDATAAYLRMLFETAYELARYFYDKGIRGKHRDFTNIADLNISLIDSFIQIRGLAYSMKWNAL